MLTDSFMEERVVERGSNRREYPRIPYERCVRFVNHTAGYTLKEEEGIAHNVSQSGMLFSTQDVPPISSVIVFETDNHTFSRCVTIDERLLSLKETLFGKVVRVLSSCDGDLFQIGIRFIKESESKRADIQEAFLNVQKMQKDTFWKDEDYFRNCA